MSKKRKKSDKSSKKIDNSAKDRPVFRTSHRSLADLFKKKKKKRKK